MLQGDEDKERTRGARERFEPGPAALEQPRALRTPQADHHYPTTRCRPSLSRSLDLSHSLSLSRSRSVTMALPSHEYTLTCPPLDELRGVLEKILEAQYREVSVVVVDCPDLTREPWLLAAPGLCGNTRLVGMAVCVRAFSHCYYAHTHIHTYTRPTW